MQTETTYMETQIKSSYLSSDDEALELMCLTQTQQRTTIWSLDCAAKVIIDFLATLEVELKGRGLVSQCGTLVGNMSKHVRWIDMQFCAENQT